MEKLTIKHRQLIQACKTLNEALEESKKPENLNPKQKKSTVIQL